MELSSRKKLGTIVFLAGLSIALALAVINIWGEVESTSYFYVGVRYPSFRGLICPALISTTETATITGRFDNPTDQNSQPYYTLKLSGIPGRVVRGSVPLSPHSGTVVHWSVDANDIDLGYFVMADLVEMPAGAVDAHEATCGVLVANLGVLSGEQVTNWGLVLGLLGIALGLAIRERSEIPVQRRQVGLTNGLRSVGVTTLLALMAGLASWWLIGVIFLAITCLLLMTLLGFAMQ